MNDRIANQLASYRTRLDCLDQPNHLVIWKDLSPLAFTSKAANYRASTQIIHRGHGPAKPTPPTL
jgi:hypothetical protein